MVTKETLCVEVVAPTMDEVDTIWEQVGKLYEAYFTHIDEWYYTRLDKELDTLMSMWGSTLD